HQDVTAVGYQAGEAVVVPEGQGGHARGTGRLEGAPVTQGGPLRDLLYINDARPERQDRADGKRRHPRRRWLAVEDRTRTDESHPGRGMVHDGGAVGEMDLVRRQPRGADGPDRLLE